MSTVDFKALVESAKAARGEEHKLPPVEQWDPPLCGSIDIRITKQGKWEHEGSTIKRRKLVKLFASILKKEADEYFLVTPKEKWQLEVEDAPFFVAEVEIIEREDEQAILFTTDTGDRVIADANHPITVTADPESGDPQPYVEIRAGMLGRLSRNVYYELAKFAQPLEQQPEEYEVVSMGQRFKLI